MRRNNYHDFRNRITVCVAFLAASVYSVSVNAQTVAAPDAFGRFMSAATGAGKSTVGYGSNGTAVVSPGVPTLGADGQSGVRSSQVGNLTNSAGNPLSVTATGRVSNLAAAKAIGRAASRLVFPLTVGVAIFDLYKELGTTLVANPSGVGAIGQVQNPNYCTAAPCYEYQTSSSTAGAGGWVGPITAACKASPMIATGDAYWQYTLTRAQSPGSPGGAGYCFYIPVRKADGYQGDPSAFGLTSRDSAVQTLPPGETALIPLTQTELEDMIAKKSGWPTSSNIAKALVQSSAITGDKINPVVETLTGPATSTGTTSKTVSPTTGKTTTTTTSDKHTYSGPTVTNIVVTNTVITNTSTAAVESQTTTETEAPSAPPPAEDACKANPNRVGCLDIDTPAGEIPKSSKTITYQEENVFGTGSCPANLTASVGLLRKTVTVWDWQKTCELALPLRAIVLILASFAAFLIVMPGGAKT